MRVSNCSKVDRLQKEHKNWTTIFFFAVTSQRTTFHQDKQFKRTIKHMFTGQQTMFNYFYQNVKPLK